MPKPKPSLGLQTHSGAAGPGAKVRPQPASLLPSLSYSSLARRLPPQDSPVMLSFGAGSRLISRAVRFQLAVLPVAARRLVSQFSDFPLHPTLLARIPHPSCTEVQEKTLPLLLDGVDVLAQVRTLLSGLAQALLVPFCHSARAMLEPALTLSALRPCPPSDRLRPERARPQPSSSRRSTTSFEVLHEPEGPSRRSSSHQLESSRTRSLRRPRRSQRQGRRSSRSSGRPTLRRM